MREPHWPSGTLRSVFDHRDNPFHQGFAQVPVPEFVGREPQIGEIAAVIERPRAPDVATMLYGARGSGKTATLIEVADRARAAGCIVVETDASNEGSLLTGLPFAILDALEEIDERQNENYLKALEVRVPGSGFKFERGKKKRPSGADAGTRPLKELVKLAAARETWVMLTADELSSVSLEEALTLGSALQDVIFKKKQPLLFLGAALPIFRRTALNDRGLSFFRRCRNRTMPPISVGAARRGFQLYAHQIGGEFAADALDLAANSVDGSPYMFQLVGYYSWATSLAPDAPINLGDVQQGVRDAQAEYSQTVSDITWEELNQVEQQLLLILDETPDHYTSEDVVGWLSQLGYSQKGAANLIRHLRKDEVMSQDTKGRLRLVPGNGLTTTFLAEERKLSDAYFGASLANGTALKSALPSTRQPDNSDVCGAWMPRAERPCALPKGHAGGHRTRRWS